MKNRDEEHFFRCTMNVLIEKWMQIILLVILIVGGLLVGATVISTLRRSVPPLIPAAQKAERK